MTIWQRILDFGRSLFEDGASPALVTIETGCGPDPGDVGFTAAVIGLSAKMAKADGVVTDDEIAVFSKIFQIAPEDISAVRRVFNLAQQTVRGYQSYARRIARKYENRPCLLESVLDGLFYIAGADGVITAEELTYLENVSEAFGFSEADFRRIKAAHLGADQEDPYTILGVVHTAAFEDIRKAYRTLMIHNHPDQMLSQGAPPEFQTFVHDRAAAITSAYAKIRVERGLLAKAD